MKYLSLFSGIGGFDLAFDRVGMECVGQVEVDKFARLVLDKHWPLVPKAEDIRDVRADDFGRADVIVGGFPCPDFSWAAAGDRPGLAGNRGELWWEFYRIIREGNPEWVVAENVLGLLSANGGRDFASIIGALVEGGYGVVWRVFDSRYFGVPQRRRRVFIVGHSGGKPRPEILDLAQGLRGDSTPVSEAWSEATALTTNGIGSSGPDAAHAAAQHLVPMSVGALTSRVNGGGFPGTSGAQDGHVFPVALHENQRAEIRLSDSFSTLTTQGGKPGQGYPAVFNGVGVRKLTPVECERLQGFPDGWTDVGRKDMNRYRQLGNAVTVPVAEFIGQNIVNALRPAAGTVAQGFA